MSEEKVVKSGVIIILPLNQHKQWVVCSESGKTDIIAWIDEETDTLNIKVRYWGTHESLLVVPELDHYPMISGNEVANKFEDQIEAEKELFKDSMA